MTQTLRLARRVLALDKALILSLATSRESWCSSGTDVTASVPLLFGLVGAGPAGQASVRVRCAVVGADPGTWHQDGLWGRNSSSAPLRRPGPRGLATIFMWRPLGHRSTRHRRVA
jgi:hypothetical protein